VIRFRVWENGRPQCRPFSPGQVRRHRLYSK
jgi:hypothetical protein